MYGILNRPAFSDLTGEDTFILARRNRMQNDYLVATVRLCDRDVTGAKTEFGMELAVERRHGEISHFVDPDENAWSLYFSLPLPEGADEDRIAYARAIRAEPTGIPSWNPPSEWDNTVAFLVTGESAEAVTGHIVSRMAAWTFPDDGGTYSYRSLDHDEIVPGVRQVGDFFLTNDIVEVAKSTLPTELAVGDVLVGTGISVRKEGDRHITDIENAVKLPFKADETSLAEVFPERPDRFPDDRILLPGHRFTMLAPVAEWLYQREIAKRRQEPDHALVVVFPDELNPTKKSEHVSILASSGVVFYTDHNGHAHDTMSSEGFRPGIHYVTQPRFWAYRSHEGEWDGGFEFEDEPATRQHVEELFGLDDNALGRLIRDSIDADDHRFAHMDDTALACHFLAMMERDHSVIPNEATASVSC